MWYHSTLPDIFSLQKSVSLSVFFKTKYFIWIYYRSGDFCCHTQLNNHQQYLTYLTNTFDILWCSHLLFQFKLDGSAIYYISIHVTLWVKENVIKVLNFTYLHKKILNKKCIKFPGMVVAKSACWIYLSYLPI